MRRLAVSRALAVLCVLAPGCTGETPRVPPPVPADSTPVADTWPSGATVARRVERLRADFAAQGIGVDDLRRRLEDPHPEDARMVEATIRLLDAAGEPAADVERTAVWRRVLAGPTDLGVRAAMLELISLRDRESYDRIELVLDWARRGARLGERLDPDFDEDVVERYRALLAKARAEGEPPR